MVPDAAALAAFADWMRALLPRLLLYPGGLFAALGGLLLTLALRRGDPAAPGAPPPAGSIGLAALALAWTGWALLPLPGATALPGAPDLLTPLALLLGAALLDQAAHGAREGWQREVAGRPLLVAAPLIAQGAAGALLPAATPAAPTLAAQSVVVLAGLAYLAGFLVCYAAPGAAPWARVRAGLARPAGWLIWWGWLGVGLVLVRSGTLLLANAPLWTGALVVALVAAAVAGVLRIPLVRRLSARAAPWGWAALALAILVGLIAPGL